MHEAILGDRYLLCSDGLTDVVTDQSLHTTLVNIADPDKAVRDLIDQAIANGGPDNITCIVADVVDTVTGPVPPSDASVLAGAAANSDGRPRTRPSSNTIVRGRHKANGTVTLIGSPDEDADEDQSADGQGDGQAGEAAAPEASRRRWPVVTTILVILLLVVLGAGYWGWRTIQSQYYVATDGAQVIIYRGINDSVAGVKLSHVYKKTGISVTHVTVADRGALPTSPGSLTQANQTVHNIMQHYRCQVAIAALAKWTTTRDTLLAQERSASKNKKKHTTQIKIPPKPAVPAYCGQAAS
jgi:protein phosphatase